MRYVVFITTLLLITACGSYMGAHETRTPSGRRGYILKCKEKSDCWIMAGRYCPNGYEQVNETRRRHTVLVECK